MSEIGKYENAPALKEVSQDAHDANNTPRAKDAKTVKQLDSLKNSLTPQKYTPEESAKERDRILSLLKDIKFDDTMREFAQAAIRDKHIPKEVMMSMEKAAQIDSEVMKDVLKNNKEMTFDDQEAVVFAMFGGESVFKEFIQALPGVTVEVPLNTEWTQVQNVAGKDILPYLVSKEIIAKYS